MLRHCALRFASAKLPVMTLPDSANDPHTMSLPDTIVRGYLVVTLLAALSGWLAQTLLPSVLQPTARLGIQTGLVLLIGGCLLALRQQGTALHRSLVLAAVAGASLTGVLAWLTGWGLRTGGLVFLPISVMLACTLTSRRRGLLVAGNALAVLLLLAATDPAGLKPALPALPLLPALPPFPAAPAIAPPLLNTPPFGPALVPALQPTGRPPGPPLLQLLVLHLAALVVAMLAGLTLARLVSAHLRLATEREQRFRDLLGIAASAYWETDAALRLTQLSRREGTGRAAQFVLVAQPAGRLFWDLPALQCDAAAIDRLRADMESRVRLDGVAFTGRAPDGSLRYCRVSGEPRFGGSGRFVGYWGVARDVTDEHRARLALAATETQYHDLFNRIPTPLTLHSGGRIVDANAAAARLLDYASVDDMLGCHLISTHVAPADQARVLARQAQLDTLPLGEVLPAVELTMRSTTGRLVQVRSAGVRAEHNGQPAMLSITIDETASRSAALALARSQALLARVVSMSPDIITLTDLVTGRYVMVNESFCRLLGYSAEQAQGRTSAELGLWHNPADRAQLLAAIHEHGLVQDRLIRFVTHGAQVLPLLISGTRFEIDGVAYLLLNGRDTSEASRVRAEREAILAHASVGIAFTRHRRFVLVNALFERMYGWPEGALVGQPLAALWSDAAHFEALQQQVGSVLARGEAVDIERLGQRRDGSRFTVRLRANAINPADPALSGTIWIAEDVSAARAADRTLAQARDAAEAASRAKSAFLANTSHEIRTPLNGVLGLARMARQPGLAPERLQQYLAQMGDSAEHLSAILSDILDMAKIEAGKLHTEAAPFDLGGLLQSLAGLYGALAADQGLGFALQADPALPAWVHGDALRLRQVLDNFLNNALKFCACGSVRLVAQALPGERVWLEVHDTGPGIDAATQARLFQPFTQADTSTTRRWGGTGLGLSISRELAHLMGGSVGLRSAPGQGSCFYVELPLPAAPDPTSRAHSNMLPAPGPGDERLRGARVLLVEDNSVNLLVGTALLEHWAVHVTTATDGAQALAALAQADAQGCLFDMVLMDLQMPGMGGLEATRQLRQRYNAAQLPVIAVTAAVLVSESAQAQAMGMTDFLSKPINPDQLRAALLRALAQPKPSREPLETGALGPSINPA